MTDLRPEGNFPDNAIAGKGTEQYPNGMADAPQPSLKDAIDRIFREKEKKQRIIVAIDGPCASGKTTLAGVLAPVFGAGVVHTDDFVIPHWMKTPERLRVPGGNLDDKRLTEEVLEPWAKGERPGYHRYDCHGGCFVPAGPVPEGDVLILEGSYALLPSVRRFADVSIFVSAPWEARKERLIKREGPGSFERFMALWIPLENAYFEAYGLPDGDCVVIGSKKA